jgi:hypothetical protein
MPQLDFDGANSKISADKLQGQSGTSVTVPTGHTLAGTDANSITINGVNAVAVAPSTSGNVLTSNGSAWASQASAGGGKVLQCLSVTKTDSVTNNNATFTTISGLSQAITPSASSKILVMFNVNINGNNGGSGIQIVRDSTALAIGDVASSRKRVTANSFTTLGGEMKNLAGQYLDDPSADGSTAFTYAIQWRSNGDEIDYLNRTETHGDTTDADVGSSGLTLIEIGA